MPIVEDDETTPAQSQPPSLIQRVRAGNALPILSHSAVCDLALFGYEPFIRFYAKRIRYPYDQLPDLGQLANYDRYTHRDSDVACKEFYQDCVKNHIYFEAKKAGVDADSLADASEQVDRLGISAFAHLLGYPRFDQPQTFLLSMLANLPFKTYLTTSPTTFMEDALRRAGKEPLTKMCRWSDSIDVSEKELWSIPDDYRPSDKRPLVYHLCGLDAHTESGGAPLPASLALSEDDHLELLVNLAQDRGKESADRVPALVRGALDKDVIVLGFRLDSWAFRALYYGLIRHSRKNRDRRGVCVIQLPPDEREKQEKYLHGYLDNEARLDIVWKELNEYALALKK